MRESCTYGSVRGSRQAFRRRSVETLYSTDRYMSSKKGYSRRGLFGEIIHYDANGRKIGESRPGLFGGMNDYDAKGRKVGHSDPGLFGDWNHYED